MTVGRLAPSPTGILHLGNVRTFLFAWLAARAAGGRVVLRIEDLEKPLAGLVLEEMLSDLAWLGFDWDEGPAWTPEAEAELAEIKRYPKARSAAERRAKALREEASSPSVDSDAPPSWISAIGRDLPWKGNHAPYIQSLRAAWYVRVFESLRHRGLIYPCTCARAEYAGMMGAPHAGEAEPRYPGTCRGRWPDAESARDWLRGQAEPAPAGAEGFSNAQTRRWQEPVWRFRVPDGPAGRVDFVDRVAGSQAIDVAGGIGDFVAFRRPEQPSYQVAVVADDLAMGVNQVVRGADLIPSTGRQILVRRALLADAALWHSGRPGLLGREGEDLEYAHVPLVLGPDGGRLAKRHGDGRLRSLREAGVPPGRVWAWLAGQSGLGSHEFVELRSIIQLFAWQRVPTVPLVFDEVSLKRFC